MPGTYNNHIRAADNTENSPLLPYQPPKADLAHVKSPFILSPSPKDPDTVRNAFLYSSEDTQTLTGKAGMIRAGFPVKLVEIFLRVSWQTNCRFVLRAGVPPNCDKGQSVDFKNVYIKTKTYPWYCTMSVPLPDGRLEEIVCPASFVAGTIPENFNIIEMDKLPKNVCFVPLPVRLSEILFYAQTDQPFYTNLRIEGDSLKFNMPYAPIAAHRQYTFSLNLAQKKKPDFTMGDQTSTEKNELANHEFMPWRDVSSVDLQKWLADNNLQWDEEKLGSLESALNFSYLASLQKNEDCEPEPLKVAATSKRSIVNGEETIITRIITGDVDLCLIGIPISITVFGKTQSIDPKFVRLHSMKDLEPAAQDDFIENFLELYILHKNSSEKREESAPYQLEEEHRQQIVYDMRDFLPSAGCLSLYELLNIYLVNKAHSEAYPNFGRPVQHGPENNNPGTLLPLKSSMYTIFIEKTPIKSLIECRAEDSQITIEEARDEYIKIIKSQDDNDTRKDHLFSQADQEGEMVFFHKIYTFDEQNLLLRARKDTEANYYFRVHPQWMTDEKFNNDAWADIVTMQLKNFPQYVDKETLDSYNHHRHPVTRLRTSFSKLTSSPLLKNPTITNFKNIGSPLFQNSALKPPRRLSQSDEFKEGQFDILQPLKRENSQLSQSTTTLIERPPERKILNRSDDTGIMPVQNNVKPDFFSSLNKFRRQSLSALQEVMGKSSPSIGRPRK